MEKTSTKSKKTENKTSQHATKYVIVGIGITVFNYLFYTLLSNIIINDNNYLWLSSLISTTVTTIVAFIAHSNITWKDRNVSKHSIIRFFVWNALLAIAVGPWLTQLFSYFTPLYELAFHIFEFLHIPFSYEFTLTTGAFVLTSIVTMILNFLFYDKFVFGKTNKDNKEDK